MPFRSIDMRRWSTRRSFLRQSLASGTILAVVGSTVRFGHTRARAFARQADESAPLLIDADWLKERQAANTGQLVLLDLGDLGDYRDGHLPGAIHSYCLETVERDYPFYGTVLNQFDPANEHENQGKRIAWMRRYGVGPESHVIAYDHGDGRRAARIVWFLHFLGHSRASLLDGGITAWRVRGLPLSTDERAAASLAGDPIVSPQSGYYLATDELQTALADPHTLLIDLRTEQERRDTVGGQFPTGLIPGSLHVPWTGALRDGEHRLREPDELRAWAEAAGIDPARRVILYGRFGCDTNLMWLALRQAGYPPPEVYDRGWVEWAATGLPSEPLP